MLAPVMLPPKGPFEPGDRVCHRLVARLAGAIVGQVQRPQPLFGSIVQYIVRWDHEGRSIAPAENLRRESEG